MGEPTQTDAEFIRALSEALLHTRRMITLAAGMVGYAPFIRKAADALAALEQADDLAA